MTRPVRVPPWPRSSVTVWASVACGSSSTARVTVATAIRVRRRMPDLLSVGAAARDPQGRPAAGIGRTGTAGFTGLFDRNAGFDDALAFASHQQQLLELDAPAHPDAPAPAARPGLHPPPAPAP